VAAEAALHDVADVHLRDEAADAVLSAPPEKEKCGDYLCTCIFWHENEAVERKSSVGIDVDLGGEATAADLSRPLDKGKCNLRFQKRYVIILTVLEFFDNLSSKVGLLSMLSTK
jgi:hypothetical protein